MFFTVFRHNTKKHPQIHAYKATATVTQSDSLLLAYHQLRAENLEPRCHASNQLDLMYLIASDQNPNSLRISTSSGFSPSQHSRLGLWFVVYGVEFYVLMVQRRRLYRTQCIYQQCTNESYLLVTTYVAHRSRNLVWTHSGRRLPREFRLASSSICG